MVVLLICFLVLSLKVAYTDYIFIPMDLKQVDHLKPYGVVYNSLMNGINCFWVINYRGGSFVIPYTETSLKLSKESKINFSIIDEDEWNYIVSLTNSENINVILLTKAPKIGLYRVKIQLPYDDAVEIALNYAGIPYEEITDEDILKDQLKIKEIDWLHFDHEDFTGQFGKFYASYRTAPWYINYVSTLNNIARRNNFKSVAEMKKSVALKIKEYIKEGGFLFGMCAGTDTLDIALASLNVDIVPEVFDGTPVDQNFESQLDYGQTLTFKDFNIITDPFVYEYANIDYPNYDINNFSHPKYFYLKEFSAKYDPISAMLVQNHTREVKEFLGQTTAFKLSKLKEYITVLADYDTALPGYAKYIRGEVGKGAFCFLGGHDPEDFSHYIGDPPTDLNLAPNSPGYRLILNNVLFPASEKKKRKT